MRRGETIRLELEVMPIVSLLLSVPPVCTTANIMLANNICDVEKDAAVEGIRPILFGQKGPLPACVSVLRICLDRGDGCSGILSPVCLLSLLTIFIVQKNVNIFMERQDKASTFITIKNYIIIMGSLTATVFISAVL